MNEREIERGRKKLHLLPRTFKEPRRPQKNFDIFLFVINVSALAFADPSPLSTLPLPCSVIVCNVFMFLSSEVFGIIFVRLFGHVKLKPEVEAKVDFLTLS